MTHTTHTGKDANVMRCDDLSSVSVHPLLDSQPSLKPKCNLTGSGEKSKNVPFDVSSIPFPIHLDYDGHSVLAQILIHSNLDLVFWLVRFTSKTEF